MKPLVIASNMYNEIDQLVEWFDFVEMIADHILIVDTGSTDGTIEFAKGKGAEVIVDDIIKREGYGPARNHLREMSRQLFPEAHWMMYLDADERIMVKDFHRLRFIKDYLIDIYDVVALPRIDWMDKEMTKAAKEVAVYPDWQARMTRLRSPLRYVRRLHEQLEGYSQIYTNDRTPAIHHFHRSAGQEKRDRIGKLCAHLHTIDEYKDTYPEHPKEAMYRDKLKEEGLD